MTQFATLPETKGRRWFAATYDFVTGVSKRRVMRQIEEKRGPFMRLILGAVRPLPSSSGNMTGG